MPKHTGKRSGAKNKSPKADAAMSLLEEEQRMKRRGIDEGKKAKKKTPSDPMEHIRTLYGAAYPNDRVWEARKRLYDRYVKQGKLEPIPEKERGRLFNGYKVDAHKRPDGRKEHGRGYPPEHEEQAATTQAKKSAKALDKYVKEGSPGKKESSQAQFDHLEARAKEDLGLSQDAQEFIQHLRLKRPSIQDSKDAYHSELVDWRKKNKKPLSPRKR